MDPTTTTSLDSTFELVWKDVGFKAGKKVVLRGSSGWLRSGQMLALMGPSGAGKSTLLECLTGKRISGRSGEVFVRGSRIKDVKVAFIPQEDNYFDVLTVKECVMFASKFLNSTKQLNGNLETISDPSGRRYSNLDTKYHRLLVDEVLKKLGLDICADVRVISCSGGQKKRLSIAQELVTKPSLLILDEPTSGLDSKTCFQLIRLLQQLTESSDGKMAIMATIHQPSTSVFNLFDMIYMISSTGDCMYHGPPPLIERTFSKCGLNLPEFENPADFAMEVAGGKLGQAQLEFLVGSQRREFNSRYSEKPDLDRLDIMEVVMKKNKFPNSHIWYHIERTVQEKVRDPLVTGLRTLLTIIFPLAMAAVFGKHSGLRGGCPSLPPTEFEPSDLDYSMEQVEKEIEESRMNQGLLFFTLLFVTFNALLINCITLPRQMKIFVKETYNGWFGSFSFFLGTSIAEIPFSLVLIPGLIVLLWQMTGQVQEMWRFISFNLFMIALDFLAQSFVYIIGTIYMENPALVVFLTPLLVIPFTITSGIFVEIPSMPPFLQLASQVNFLRYAMEGSYLTIYGFQRCGQEAKQKLLQSRDALTVWLGAFLGTFDDTVDNSTSVTRVSDKFVDNLVSAVTDRFIAKDGQVYSAVLVDLEIYDTHFSTCWIMLLVLILVKRIVAFYIVDRASKPIK